MPLPTWMADLRALDLLLSVAETGSLSRAATVHQISQPSASARLARLERLLGVELLVRGPRGSSLTPAGQTVASWAREILAAAHVMADGVLSLRADRQARLRIAASLTIAEYLLPRWLVALRRQHPDLDISASVANTHEVCDLVVDGSVDLGFVEGPDLPSGLSGVQIGRDTLVLVTSPDSAAASTRGSTLTSELLQECPLLLREPGSGTRETFLRALTSALGRSAHLPHAITLGSTAVILSAAQSGGGIGVISRRAAAGMLGSGRLVELDVAGLDLQRPLRAIWIGRSPSPLAAELLSILRDGEGAASTPVGSTPVGSTPPRDL